MAKQTTIKKPAAKAPAPKAGSGVVPRKASSATVLSEEAAMAGPAKGYENVQAKDLMIPRLVILHQQSPQLLKSKPEYIKGAEAGDFCDTATGDVWKETLPVIPVFFVTVYLEWAPRDSGRGLVKNHGTDTTLYDSLEPDEKGKRYTEEGNYVQETATWFVILPDAGYRRAFIPLASTQLKASRKWNTAVNQMRHETKDGRSIKPSMWYREWIASPAEQSNNEGTWNLWRFEAGRRNYEIDPSGALWKECEEFYRQSASGQVKGDVGSGDEAGSSSPDEDGAM